MHRYVKKAEKAKGILFNKSVSVAVDRPRKVLKETTTNFRIFCKKWTKPANPLGFGGGAGAIAEVTLETPVAPKSNNLTVSLVVIFASSGMDSGFAKIAEAKVPPRIDRVKNVKIAMVF